MLGSACHAVNRCKMGTPDKLVETLGDIVLISHDTCRAEATNILLKIQDSYSAKNNNY